MFNGENDHIWVVKMKFYLRSLDLRNIVISKANSPVIERQSYNAQINAYEEEKLKKDRAIACVVTFKTC